MAESGVVVHLSPGGDTWLRHGRPWTPRAPLFAVVGLPVAHSLSPQMQSAALNAAGLEGVYVALALAPEQWPLLRRRAADLALRGFNVTIPYKETVAALCDSLTTTARRAGAVNTVLVAGRWWHGDNTDVGGISDVLAHIPQAERRRALVCGAGGVARAAVLALAELAWPAIVVAARPGRSRQRFTAWLARRLIDPVVELVDWGDPAATGPVDTVVVAVPGGVDPRVCLSAEAPPSHWLDLRYGVGTTPPPQGVTTCHAGLEVLVRQGERAFRWWHGRPAPVGVMAAALGLPGA